jgi:hypothetical protein
MKAALALSEEQQPREEEQGMEEKWRGHTR